MPSASLRLYSPRASLPGYGLTTLRAGAALLAPSDLDIGLDADRTMIRLAFVGLGWVGGIPNDPGEGGFSIRHF
jgi:hypothetical protein